MITIELGLLKALIRSSNSIGDACIIVEDKIQGMETGFFCSKESLETTKSELISNGWEVKTILWTAELSEVGLKTKQIQTNEICICGKAPQGKYGYCVDCASL